MNRTIKISALAAFLALPLNAFAQNDAPKDAGGMNGPMMSNSGALQMDMRDVMAEMANMMKETNDPALKARMQKLHDHMAAMMSQMKKSGGMMGGGMMGGGMMGGGMKPCRNSGDGEEAAPLPAAPDDHNAHHPGQ